MERFITGLYLTKYGFAAAAIYIKELQHQEEWAFEFLSATEAYYLLNGSTLGFPQELRELKLN